MMDLGLIAAAVLGMTEPACDMPPPGASPECVACYDDACDDYLASWEQCQALPQPYRAECRAYIKGVYNSVIAGCDCEPAAAFIAVMPEPVGRRLLGVLR